MKNIRFMVKKCLIIIFLGLISCKSLPSQNKLDLTKNLFDSQLNIDRFLVDKLDNIYVLDLNSELHKYDSKGNYLVSYSNKQFGAIDYIDLSNPLKIVLFFVDFQKIIFLDNALNETDRVDFQNLGFTDVSTAGISNDNNLWLYDAFEFRIKKINQDGELRVESDILVPYIEDIDPKSIKETENYLLLNDPKNGLHIFDNFTRYIKSLKVDGIEEYTLKGQFIFYLKEGQIHKFDIKNSLDNLAELPSMASNSKIQSFHLGKTALYLLREKKLLRIKL